MDRRCLEYPEEQIVPKAFDLHIFTADNAQIDQHVAADEKLHDMARIGLSLREERQSQRQTAADIAEIKQIEEIVLGQPQADRNGFKDRQHQKRRGIFFQISASLPRRFFFILMQAAGYRNQKNTKNRSKDCQNSTCL